MTTYLITGATGGYGSKVLEILASKVDKKDIYALVRSEEKGAELKRLGFNLRIADYDNKADLEKAFEGIDKVLFVSGSVPGARQAQHRNVIEAAQAAGVGYIAYTSLAGLDTVAADFPLGDDHRFTEQLLSESGLAYTALRNNWYLENELPLIEAALKTGQFVHYAGSQEAAWVSRDDLAEAGANMLLSDNPAQIVELSGENRTYADIFQAAKEVTGADMTLVEANQGAVVENFTATGMEQELAEMLAGFQGAIAGGFLIAEKSDLETVLGRPQTPIIDSLKELL
ncbi:SDR family oxidoreductase [Streptococcus merionis]|uniref:SDR family oxidoreductase n=1 Tax=Streptococcus merionis TaxID=400065 RepID=UPI003513D31E